MAEPDRTREDLAATLATRKELGPDYEAALVESFLDKVDAGIAARVDERVAARLGDSADHERDKSDTNNSFVLGLVSLGVGIPITAISAGTEGVPGLIVAWAGIAAVNAAHALRRGRRR